MIKLYLKNILISLLITTIFLNILCGCKNEQGLTNEQITEYFESDFLIAYELYQHFYREKLLFDENMLYEKGASVYALVTDERYVSYNIFKTSLQRFFAYSIYENELLPMLEGYEPLYFEYDGKTYVDTGRQSEKIEETFLEETFKITKKDGNTAVFIVSAWTINGNYNYTFFVKVESGMLKFNGCESTFYPG